MTGDLDQILFYAMDKAIRSYRQFAQHRLKEAGFEVTIDQWIILKCLIDDPSMTQSKIAEKVFKDNASVTRMVDLLVKGNLIERSIDPNNRRRHILTVTQKGRKDIEKMEPLILENRSIALKDIPEKHLKCALETMHAITKNLSDQHES